MEIGTKRVKGLAQEHNKLAAGRVEPEPLDL